MDIHMKKYTHYLPITAFAAALALGGTVHANENNTEKESRLKWSTRTLDDSASGQHLSRTMKASKLLGMNIDTVADEKVGEIDEIFIHSDTGKVLAMVVSTGGFLGMGQQQSLLSPDDLRFNDDRTLMQTDLSKNQIGTAPGYKSGETTGLDQVRPLGKRALNNEAGAKRGDDRNKKGQTRHRRMMISDLMGMGVENHQGEEIGDVDEVYLDLDQREVVGVVVSTGGFLGLGDQKTLFGMSEVTLDPTNEKVVLNYTRDQIKALPAFMTDEDSVREDLRQYMDRLEPRALNTPSGNAARARAHEMRGTSDKTEMDKRDNSENSSVSGNTARIHADEMNGTSDKTVFDQDNSSKEIDHD